MSIKAVSEYYSSEKKNDGSELQNKGLELVYFGAGGLGACIRLACVLGNVAFRDLHVKGPAFEKMKADGLLPYNQLPTLFVDGFGIGQSFSILRYVGRRGGLYPSDNLLAAKVDAFLGLIQERLQNPLVSTMKPQNMGWLFDK